MVQVTEVRSIDALAPYRLAWNELLGKTPGATFFQTYECLEAYWRHFGQNQSLKVLVVQRGNETLGIVPLCVRPVAHRLATLKTVSYPLDDWGAICGPVGSDQAATLTMAIRYLAGSPRDWECIDLRSIPHRIDRGRTVRAMSLARLTTSRSEYERLSVIDSCETWEAYLGTRDSKTRRGITSALRRGSNAKFEFVRHRPLPAAHGGGDPAWDLYDECLEVAKSSWQAKVVDGNTLCHSQYRDFYRDAHAAAARIGMLDMALLRYLGRPVAFLYSYHTQGRVQALRMGFDPQAAPSGAGMQLLMWVLRDGYDRGDLSVDMGPGDQPYKQRLLTRIEVTSRLTHVPEFALKGQFVRASQWLGDRGRRLIKAGAI